MPQPESVLQSSWWSQPRRLFINVSSCYFPIYQHKLVSTCSSIYTSLDRGWYSCLQKLFVTLFIYSALCLSLSLPFLALLTHPLKARKEALKEAFTRVRHGQGTEFRHHDSVPFAVLLVGVAAQEPAHVCHLAFLYLKLVKQGHPIKPVVVAVEK